MMKQHLILTQLSIDEVIFWLINLHEGKVKFHYQEQSILNPHSQLIMKMISNL